MVRYERHLSIVVAVQAAIIFLRKAHERLIFAPLFDLFADLKGLPLQILCSCARAESLNTVLRSPFHLNANAHGPCSWINHVHIDFSIQSG